MYQRLIPETGNAILRHAAEYLSLMMDAHAVARLGNRPGVWYWYRSGFYAIQTLLTIHESSNS